MKCPSCGANNPDYTFYCGSCAKELPRRTRPAETQNDEALIASAEAGNEESSQDWTTANLSQNALVAIAINVRRLFLVALLGMLLLVFSSMSTSLITMMVVNNDFSISSTSLFISAFAGIVIVIAIVGIVYIVYGKKLTTL